MNAVPKPVSSLLHFLLLLLLAACSPGAGDEAAVRGGPPEEPAQVSAAQARPSEAPPTSEPEETPLPATATPVAPTASATPTEEVVEPMQPPETPTPTANPVVEYYEIVPIGSTADFTASNDIAGVEGQVEVVSENQIKISDFVALLAAAPGVDIRLGIDGDYSDEVAVVLKDITGKNYEGRTLTLTIPDRAFDGQTYDGIAVICFDTGELFDAVTFASP